MAPRRSFTRLGFFSSLLFAVTVSATLLADLNPAKANAKVSDVGLLNASKCPIAPHDKCQGYANPTNDQLFTVKNGRYTFSKPAKFNRAEVHGIKNDIFKEGKTYYLSWDFALSGLPPALTCAGQDRACYVQSNRIFQYHTFGTPNTLDIPLQLRITGGRNTVDFVGMSYINGKDEKDGRTETVFWTSPALSPNTIYSVALQITTARSSKGATRFWWNGKQQLLNQVGGGPKNVTANLQTWDGTSVDPKWGVYGAWSTALTTTIGRIRLGTTLKDVSP